MNFLKIGAYILVTIMGSPLIVWAGNQLLKVASIEARVMVNEKNIDDSEIRVLENSRKINEIHWYLIKKNNVQVPLEVKRGN